jgi:hypothetical protein
MFRGEFKFKTYNGKNQYYFPGEIVFYQGKLYECLKTTTNSPEQSKLFWKYSGNTEIFYGSNPPINPVEGQEWVTPSGSKYIWYNDGNSFQWIET